MKIRAILFFGTLGTLCQQAFAFTDVCSYLPPSMDLIHYVTLTSAEAQNPDVEGYGLFTDAYDENGSWIGGGHEFFPDNNGTGMQPWYDRLLYTGPGDMIYSPGSHLVTDYNGEQYISQFNDYYEDHYLYGGNECWAVEPM